MRIAMWMLAATVLTSATASASPRSDAKARRRAKAPMIEPVVAADLDDDLEVDDDDNDDDDGDDEAVESAPAPTKVRKRARARSSRPAKREIYFRAGFAHVNPRITSGGLELQPEGITRLAAPMAPTGGAIETAPSTIILATIGFAPATFRGYLAFETIIGLPKRTKLRASGDLATVSLAPTALGMPTGIQPLGEELGEASALPPMITAVVRYPATGRVRAYAGGGASVLIVRDARITNKVLTEVATPKLEISPTFGVVAQVGIDVQLHDRFYARLDFKEMWFQPAETKISNIHVRTTIPLLETIHVGSARSESTANPIIVQFGIGASF